MDEHNPTREPMAVNPPTRGADRNQSSLTEGGRSRHEDLLLPSLDDGVTLLDVDGRHVRVLQSLVLDHMLMNSGPAYWVDALGYAMTTSLARLAPSQRLLNRIHVARGFTAYQHYSLLDHLPTAVSQHVQAAATMSEADVWQSGGGDCRHTEGEASETLTPALIVAPAVDVLYRKEDSLEREQAATLQTRAVTLLRKYADGFDAPVIVTRTQQSDFTAPVETIADNHLRCEITDLGPRFVGDEFETKLYPLEDGFYQTTLAYWRDILESRIKQVGLSSTPEGPPQPADTGLGKGSMMDGSDQPLNPNPLQDALSANRSW
ncbi:hypothetical protein KZ498_23700 [Haloarcula sp. 1CSR25-25]|nr:hypothetical protein [Haloarcula sp. 1CSR25-25]